LHSGIEGMDGVKEINCLKCECTYIVGSVHICDNLKMNLKYAILEYSQKYPQNNLKFELNIDKNKKSVKIKTELFE
jgi:hypothetical protein